MRNTNESFLRDYQSKAVGNMKDGCILNGGVGSGKSRTGLYYYYKEFGGYGNPVQNDMVNPIDLYIITTAKKRDTFEWESEIGNYKMSTDENLNYYDNKIIIDSWNNIKKYAEVENSFFIFDEQKAIGKGTWAKAFIKISKKNRWIMLSATAGDCWTDYIPVFIANGFYRNRTEFTDAHIEYDRVAKFPKIKAYHNTGRLVRLRNNILVNMDFDRPTVSHHEDVNCLYDKILYKDICKNRWNYAKDKPIENASEFCYELRRIVNSDPSRLDALRYLIDNHAKTIIFYNFDYELELLKDLATDMCITCTEWNGHSHQPVPDDEKWIYLVQYNAGAEGWNCIKTDTIIFYSQNYSYKIMEQASGRINRLNTPFRDLYYYHLKSKSGIDLAIAKALKEKKKFNENKFINS